MEINLVFDSSVSNAPAGFTSAIEYAVSVLDAAFTNPVTINIDVGWGEVGGTSLLAGDLGESLSFLSSYSYSAIKGALIAEGNSPIQQSAYATLPATDPTKGSGLEITTAEAKALGLLPGSGTSIDGDVGFDSTASWSFSPTATPTQNAYDFIAVAEHEISEVLGRLALSGAYSVIDLFRFSAPGVRELSPSRRGSNTTGYFSIDNGAHNLGTWNNVTTNGDLGDWYPSGPAPGGNDAFNDYSNAGVINALSQDDLELMNVLGWDPSAPANTVINGETYFVSSGAIGSGLIVQSGGFVNAASGGIVSGVTISGGTVLLSAGAVVSGGIAFASGGTLEILGTQMPSATISGFSAGDTIDLASVAPASGGSAQRLCRGGGRHRIGRRGRADRGGRRGGERAHGLGRRRGIRGGRGHCERGASQRSAAKDHIL
jgi:hypothetical protein